MNALRKIFMYLNFWPLTGERRRLDVLHWALSLCFAGVFGIGYISFFLNSSGSIGHEVGIILMVAGGVLEVAHTVYRLAHAQTHPQLLLRQYHDTKKDSATNTKELLDFAASLEQKGKK